MNQKHSDTEKGAALERNSNGESVSSIISATSLPRSTFYYRNKQQQSADKRTSKKASLKNFRMLEQKWRV